MTVRREPGGLVRRYLGDKSFILYTLGIAVPIMIQNGITNFVSLLDNIMIGRVGTAQMSGASIVNQLLFVYNLMIFGGVSGAGIFTAQFYGQKNLEGVRQTFRYKLYLGILLTSLAFAVFLTSGPALIQLYLTGEGAVADREATLSYGLSYLRIMLIGLPVFMLVQAFASTLRECGETIIPMAAGISAVFVNLVFNYLLIYGRFGFPRWGVVGAAAATVLSRFVELAIVLVASLRQKARFPYLKGLFSTLGIPLALCRKIFFMGTPLLLNETLWSAGMAFLAQCYSVRGLNVVAAMNISSTINNLFSVVFISLGNSVAIIVGQILGTGDMKRAKETAGRLIIFSVCACAMTSLVMFPFAPIFPRIYNTSEDVRAIASSIIKVCALFMPMHAFLNACYFTLRAGGKTVITFLFDSVFCWCVSVPVAFLLTRFTGLGITQVYIFVSLMDLLKCVLGYVLVRKGVWLQNIVAPAGK